MDNKIIAVFGGSFNPPTVAHIEIAKQIVKNIENIEKIIFVPVSTKYNKKGLAPDEERYNMLKKICNEENIFEVSKIEIESEKQLYTIETLRLIKNKYPEKDICFIIGTDNLKELETWHVPAALLTEFKVIVIERENDKFEDIINKSSFLKSFKSAIIKLDNIEKIYLSSSDVRNQVKKHKSIKKMVSQSIENDVRRLYK